MVDLFISYSRANRETVRRLADTIGRLGYAVWWDEELPAHLSYGEVITEKIGEAKATLVVWSTDSAASEWVRAEADMARNQKKLIQTAIDDCVPPLPFNQIQYAAIGDWQGEEDHPGWRKVRASLVALCGPAAAGADMSAEVPASPDPVGAAPARAFRVLTPPRGRRTTRVAFVAIAASLLTILTVGGLVLFRGPPAAQAQAVPAATPGPGLATQSAVAPAEQAKPATAEAPAQVGEETVEPQGVTATVEAPAPEQDGAAE
jgi:hypothetical protein